MGGAMKKAFWLPALFGLFLTTGCLTVSSPDYKAAAQTTLARMDAAYQRRNFEDFMYYVAPKTDFDREQFATAVENDINAFVYVRCQTRVAQIGLRHANPQDDTVVGLIAKVEFSREIETYRYGRKSVSGETVLTFKVGENGDLKLTDMEEPAPYGLIVP